MIDISDNDSLLYYKGYYSFVRYDVKDKILYGRILGISDLVDFHSDNSKSIEDEFHRAVDDYIEFCKEIGKNAEKSLYDGIDHKTRFQDFLEKYPNARIIYGTNTPAVCCSYIGYCNDCNGHTDCGDCWNEPV